jgi:hypothetical protein
VSKKKPKTIDASCPVTLMGCEGEVIVEMTPTEAVSMIEKAWQENRRLRQENATLTAERDEARREVCECKCSPPKTPFFGAPQELAEVNGWDCFKDHK